MKPFHLKCIYMKKKAEDERLINRIIENVYYRCHEEPIKKSSVKEAVSDIAGAISKYAWIEENKGYSCLYLTEETRY